MKVCTSQRQQSTLQERVRIKETEIYTSHIGMLSNNANLTSNRFHAVVERLAKKFVAQLGSTSCAKM
jgi:hypothetical protein